MIAAVKPYPAMKNSGMPAAGKGALRPSTWKPLNVAGKDGEREFGRSLVD